MRFPHLFEFMDQSWLPSGLAATLREILSCGNAAPFRPYYVWVAQIVRRLVAEGGCENTVELGAGTAPVTRVLAADPQMEGVRLIVCDARPDSATYLDLEKRYPGRVTPRYEPVDFSERQDWPPKTLLLLSGTFHHIPQAARAKVLATLVDSADCVIIVEPLRKTLLSVLFVFLSTVPAIVLPLWYFGRPGKLRRFLWCWLLPIAPLMFWWDGIASCARMWTENEWHRALRGATHAKRDVTIEQTLFCQCVALRDDSNPGLDG